MNEQTVPNPSEPGPIRRFFEDAMGLALLVTLVVGAGTIATTFKRHELKLVDPDRVQIIETRWWGFERRTTSYRPVAGRWLEDDGDGRETPVTPHAVLLD